MSLSLVKSVVDLFEFLFVVDGLDFSLATEFLELHSVLPFCYLLCVLLDFFGILDDFTELDEILGCQRYQLLFFASLDTLCSI